ncbi:SGNH/GDSL hydrolase family protein [Chamaesiphon sp. VAR_48_metabat_403]|uniref:SGNH/GDSL hydrolase family protein n=1 Tax=Chamaesiphon sp. VAR_48_metabat_403 TaxID=2964700 RepID=UPI00286D7D9C|nr:SGNH/GDSL hydrolase family protein [Chamaesiphon sp. VAR_48_metabat_403]
MPDLTILKQPISSIISIGSAIGIAGLFGWMTPLAMAQQIEGITAFGDSLVDNGNVFQASGQIFPPNPLYFKGRFSNGSIWVENIAAKLKVTKTSSNFAFGGATSGTLNTIDPALPGLTTQLDRFLQTTPRIDPDRLFILWAGANDYLGDRQPNPAVTVGNLSTALQRLIDAGATQLMVPNLPDLGKSPSGVANSRKSARLTELSTVHNQLLKTSIERLSQQNPKISIISIDMQTLFGTVINNPSKFGFINVTQPCFNRSTRTVCTNPNSFLFWDELHPTAAAYQILSAHALTILQSNTQQSRSR